VWVTGERASVFPTVGESAIIWSVFAFGVRVSMFDPTLYQSRYRVEYSKGFPVVAISVLKYENHGALLMQESTMRELFY